ncbi:UDP-glycosyltransferase 92A1-like [Humulus lupulus]|uniref:UDP-glycosyltransferase 92A1-like n=1 Tax=Humulus lupulus TaxID=3486 RepID=UPI002B41749D|nr:UDP-glycosyltransferase 92A1-like [Humulus lupulus]
MSETENRNIVLFPFMAQGHIIPFLALAHRLSQARNNYYTVTLVTTQLNIPQLRLSLPPNSSIHVVGIPFSGDGYGIPSGVENTDSLPYHLMPNFFEASLSLKPHFRKLISDLCSNPNGRHRPLCIITDMFFSWTEEVASEFGVFNAIFCGCGGFGLACFYSLWMNLPHRSDGAAMSGDEISLPDFPEAGKIHVTQMSESLQVADGTDKFYNVLRKLLLSWSKADAIVFNTVEQLEQRNGLAYFRRMMGKDMVLSIGPIFSPITRSEKTTGITSEKCIKWLDSKPKKSVLYISFGSQNTISASQMMKLAMVLEASGKNFIWVVRPPIGFDINGEFRSEEWLPKGFEERISESNRGLLVRNWAPQVTILAHEAVSAFLSHCGWNSVLESLSHGVPIIGWPLAAEQFYNAKYLEEDLGVGVEVGRGKSCCVGHEEMVEKIDLVMNAGTDKGGEIRRKAYEVREMIKNAVKDEDGFKGSSVIAMEKLLNTAMLVSEQRKSI